MVKCWNWGNGTCKSYADLNNLAKQISRRRDVTGVAKDPKAMTMSRAGECACCILLRIPLERLDWQTNKTDAGFDFFYFRHLCDPKTTRMRTGRVLIFPLDQLDKLPTWKADTFIGVEGREFYHDDIPAFTIIGSVTKERFIREHLVSRGDYGEPPLVGTWYMKEEQLDPIENLMALKRPPLNDLPLARKWVNEVAARGLPATEAVWADMKRRGVV
jgi:hypothetical protein